MPELVLTEREQAGVRALMALEPTPGALPTTHVLLLISRLVPSDSIDVHVTDSFVVVAHFPYVLFGSIVFAT